MSVRIMAQVFRLDLPPSEKLVLLALADHANDDGEGIYPGRKRIAAKASLSERQTSRVLSKLEARGMIEAVSHRKGGHGSATEWRITLPGHPRPGSSEGAEDTYRDTQGDLPGHLRPLTGTSVSPQPSGTVIEPSETTSHANAAAGRLRGESNGASPNSNPPTVAARGGGAEPMPPALREGGTLRRVGDSGVPPSHNDIKAAIVAALGHHPDEITSWGRYDAAAKQLRAVGATPPEIALRAARWPLLRFTQPLTNPQSLVKQWAALGAVRAEPGRREIDRAALRRRQQEALGL